MINALITVRSKSTRLPNKCFLSFGELTVVEHVIARAKHANLRPIICTTKNAEDKKIVELSKKHNIDYFCGSEINKLKRWNDCCLHYNLKSFHTVDADDPFFCSDEVMRSHELLLTGFDMVTPSPSSSNGGATVGYSLTSKIINRACKSIDDHTDTEMMWSFLERIKGIKIYKLNDPKDYIIRERMTLDYKEDYIKLLEVLKLVGPLATRQEISDCLMINPKLNDINSFRNKEWKKNQDDKSFK